MVEESFNVAAFKLDTTSVFWQFVVMKRRDVLRLSSTKDINAIVESNIRILDLFDKSNCCCCIVRYILGLESTVRRTVIASSFAILLRKLFTEVAEDLYSSTIGTIFTELNHISEHPKLTVFLFLISFSIFD